MPNDYFQFKQFTVRQEGAAMKVGTDGVLLGAWARLSGAENRILDIGAGTGLIGLMAAQRASHALVDAVEIDPGAAAQSEENFRRSPWSDRLEMHAVSIQQYVERTGNRYDHILSNPPYFVDSLKTPDRARTTARHNDGLPFEALADAAQRLLMPAGLFSLILPPLEAERFGVIAQSQGLHLNRRSQVKSLPEGPVRRILMEFSFAPSAVREEYLVIETARHKYTEAYKALTKDFYLKF